ncbi:MAG: hypothetical protein Q8L22_24130 [Reyranella sp.]|nr:hypothetical protein [Reyranella sp.]
MLAQALAILELAAAEISIVALLSGAIAGPFFFVVGANAIWALWFRYGGR